MNSMKTPLIGLKPLILGLFLVFIISRFANAQEVRLNAYSAYVFNDRIDSYYDANNYYDGTIQGGYQWGLSLEYMVHDARGIELKYLRLDTHAPLNYYYNGIQYKDFELGMNYILIGGTNYFKAAGGKVEPYVGLAVGLALISIKNPEPGTDSSKEKFAWNVKAGTNIWITETVGIKLQADLISAVQSAGGGFYFGSGGSGAGISTYSSMYQWSIGGGLTFKFGQ